MPSVQIERTFTDPCLVELIVSFLASRDMCRVECATPTFQTAVVSWSSKATQRFMVNHRQQFLKQVDTYNSSRIFIGETRVIKRPMPGDLVLDCVDLPRGSMWKGQKRIFYEAFPPCGWDNAVRVTATDWRTTVLDLDGAPGDYAQSITNPYFAACGRDHRNEEEPSLILCSSLQDELDPTQVLRGLLQTANMTGGIIYLSSCNFQQSGTTELDVSKLLRIAESLNGVLDTTTNARTTLRCIPGSHGHDLLEVFLSCTHMYFLLSCTHMYFLVVPTWNLTLIC